MNVTRDDLRRFSKQIILKNDGVAGQKKIIDSNKDNYSLKDIKKILSGTNNEDYYKLLFSIFIRFFGFC